MDRSGRRMSNGTPKRDGTEDDAGAEAGLAATASAASPVAARVDGGSPWSHGWRHELRQVVLESRSRSELLQRLCDLGVRFLGADGGEAWRYHAATRSLRLVRARSLEADHLGLLREIPLGGGDGILSLPSGIKVFSCDAEWIEWWRHGRRRLDPNGSGRVVGCVVGDRRCTLGWIAWRFKSKRSISPWLAAMPCEISEWAPLIWHLRSRARAVRRRRRAAPAGVRRTALAARGLVHDLDNALLPLRCRVEALAAKVHGGEATRAILGMAATLEHLQSLVGDLRRRLDSAGSADGEPLRLDEWWQRIRAIVEAMLPPGCVLKARVPSGLGAVRIGEAQLTQAVCNLVSNAVAAIGPRGSIGILAERGVVGGSVTLAVEDDGTGIDSGRLASLPSTSRVPSNGRGSGLGLPLVRQLLREVGGDLEIAARRGGGTRAMLLLPEATGRGGHGSDSRRPG